MAADPRTGPLDAGHPAPEPAWRIPAAAGVIAAAALVAYATSWSGVFVFDDDHSILSNPSLRHLWPPQALLHPPPDAGVAGRPVLNVSFALNYALGGLAVRGYHAVNLLIHIAASLLLFGIVRRTLLRCGGALRADALPLALAVAALWCVHPLQTESVTYVSQRAESLMALWYLATLYCFIRSVDREPAAGTANGLPGRLSSGWACLAVAACLLGMATKEVMVTAPVLVLLYDRTYVAATWGELWRRRGVLHLGLAATWGLLAVLMAGIGNRGVGYGLGVTPLQYALAECRALVHYLRVGLWPHPLAFDYGPHAGMGGGSAPWVAAVAAITGVTAFVAWRRPRLGFPALWVLLVLAPTSSVVPIQLQPVGDNRVYLPLAGLVTLVVLGLHRLPGRRAWAWVAAAMIAAGCVATLHRNEVFGSRLGLWRDTVLRCPDNARAHNNLAQVLEAMPGRMDEAIGEYRAAVRLDPDYAEAWFNLGDAVANLPGGLAEAVADLRVARRLAPTSPMVHNNLGTYLAGTPGGRTEAIAEVRESLRLKPDYPEAHNDLGALLSTDPASQGEAAAEFGKALELRPDYAEAHENLGFLLARVPVAEARAEAIAHLRAAVRLDSGRVNALRLLNRLEAAGPAQLR